MHNAYNGLFTPALTKDLRACLKNSGRIIVQASEGDIYVATDAFAVCLNPLNYDSLVRPVTQSDAGNFSIDKDGRRESTMDIKSIVAAAVKETRDEAQPAGVHYKQRNGKRVDSYALFYNAADGTTQAYDENLVSIVSCVAPRFTGKRGIIYIDGGEPLAYILPCIIRGENSGKVQAAVHAYFNADNADNADELRNLRNQLADANNAADTARKLLEDSAKAAEELRKELDALKASMATPEHSASHNADELRAYFASLDGVEIKINGERTACPILWLTGNVKPHADEITARGAKWSVKRNAYYLRIA